MKKKGKNKRRFDNGKLKNPPAVEEIDDQVPIGEEEPDQSITVIPKSVYNISEEEAIDMIMPCAFEESVGEYEQEWEYVSTPMTLEEKIEEKVEDKMDEKLEKINEIMEEQTQKIIKMLKKKRVQKQKETQKSLRKKRKI